MKRSTLAKDILIASGPLVIGLFLSAPVYTWHDDNLGQSPNRFANLLENGQISLLQIIMLDHTLLNAYENNIAVSTFNKLREQVKYPILLQELDLSNKDLAGIDLLRSVYEGFFQKIRNIVNCQNHHDAPTNEPYENIFSK